MATTPKIRYDIEAAVSGGSDVNALANQLDGLANTLEGDLKVQALASAHALRQLGEKQGAIQSFRQLKGEVQDASARLREAQTAAQQLGQRIGGMEAPTRAQAGQLQKLRDTVRSAKTEVQSKTAALDQSRAALGRYGIGTDNLAQSERNVRTAIQASRAEVAGMVPAYARAGSAAAASGAQQSQAARSAGTELKSLGDQLRTVQNIAIGALGGSFIGSLAKDVAATADEFNNLQARVKLVTGEGDAFTTAWEGVQQIALRTNSELEGTATLFTRVAQAGKELGLSQQAALSLTETINQTIQLSGGSADSAKAAIVQLVQGLQSGVLRGEEFNSVMEQSPRLARALADGLGTTTGELRKMAAQGQLTTEVVLNALQGQSAAVATEFEKLPPTVGRAIQNLSTNWTIYVGEVDKATGASQTAANAINFLGQNLSTIAGFLLDAGQAGAAFVALRLAQTFLGLGAASQAAAVQVAASATAINATNAAAAGAVAGVGRFAAILGTLKTFTLLGIVTNFQDIGKWIGESAAKLAGYKDRTEELARAEQTRAEIAREGAQLQAAMAQATQLAADKSRGLTLEARALVTEFDKLRTGGKGVADSLEDISKKANLADSAGIQAFSLALRDLGAQGKASGDQIREAFASALKGEDLAAFEVRARLALAGTKNEAEQLATVLDASLREAIRRSGADFAVISGGMGAAARSAVNDTELIISNLDRLKGQGVDTAAALTASIGKGIQTADSRAAIEALRQQVELVRKVLGDQVANTFLDQIGAKARQVTSEVGGLADALKRLGISSDADLKLAAEASRKLYEQVRATGGSAREQGEAFRKMAADAVASGDASALAFVRAQAAMQGFEVTTDSAGKTIVRSMKDAAEATLGAGQAADGAAGSYRNMAQSAEQAAAAAQRAAKYASPLGPDKYAAPKGGSVTGNTREERLAGQNAVDNTLMFTLRDKLNAGTLSAADAEQIRAVIAALDQNEQVNRDLDRMNPGAFSLTGAADRNEWRNVRTRLDQALGEMNSQVGRTVNVNLQVGGRTQTVTTDEAGAQALISTLQNASLASRG